MSLKDFFAESGGGAPAFFNKHSAVGDMITGKIVSAEVRQMTDYDTNKPRTWDNGDPVQQVVVTIATDLRDPSIEDDTGERRVFVKWYGNDRRELLAALRAAGADDLLPGGTFTAAYVGTGEQKDRKLNPPKLYKFEYAPPSPTAGLIQQATQQQATPPAVQAVPAPAAPPADPQAALAQIKTFIALGMTDEQIAAAVPGVDATAIAAVRALPAA